MSLTIYRIVTKKRPNKVLDGEGARLLGGRWNSKGKRCVYTAGSESLAVLEVLVHAERPLVSSRCRLFELQLSEEDVLHLDKLPDNWRAEPPPPETAEIGDAWLDSNESLALAVPSTVVPREWNYLLNPKHDRFDSLVSKSKRLPFEFDSRLL